MSINPDKLQTIYLISIVCWWFLETWIIARELGDVNKSKDQSTRKYVVMGIFTAIGAGILCSKLPFGKIGINSSVRFITAIIFIWTGLIVRWRAVVTLGRFFRSTVMIQKDHKLITGGLYKYVRHPSYTGVVLMLLGTGIGLGNWLGLFLIPMIGLLGIARRIKVEEDELINSLGKEYKDYMKNTFRLIPLIY